jgi:biopolymer transport protein ExbB/TolQ
VEYAIWTLLSLLGLLASYAIFERTLFHATSRRADEGVLEYFLARVRRDGAAAGAVSDRRLGWLWRVVDRHRGDVARMLGACRRERRNAERFDRVLQMLIEVPAAVGLLGSVLGMISMGSGGGQVSQMIGLGMRATMYGMMIAIPAALFWYLTGGHTALLLEQIDEAIDAFREALTQNSDLERTNELAKSPTPPKDPAAVHRRHDLDSRESSLEPAAVQPAVYELALTEVHDGGRTNGAVNERRVPDSARRRRSRKHERPASGSRGDCESDRDRGPR